MKEDIVKKIQSLLKNKKLSMKEIFKNDPKRFEKYNLVHEGLFLDFSKNLFDHEIFELLLDLVQESSLKKKTKSMFLGEKINTSENRSVLHTALRFRNQCFCNEQIGKDIKNEKKRIKNLVEKIYNGSWKGFSGKKIEQVVNIGIGGSNLGPKMIIRALEKYHSKKVKIEFISNIDGYSIEKMLDNMNPESTLFIISSKSFSTGETLVNGKIACEWIINYFKDKKSIANHFISISTDTDKSKYFNIPSDNCFKIWEWVGGRYSLWSAVGIPIALAIGYKNFEKMLSGANSMDEHFKSANPSKNMPIILAVISILYSNFYKSQSQAVIVYSDRLKYLIEYLQQLDMESNGKSITLDTEKSFVQTGVTLWGGVGTNSQHAFHQLFHQGSIIVPIDFIMVKNIDHKFEENHRKLISNCLAQSQALMNGNNKEEIELDLKKSNLSKDRLNFISSHKEIPGNKPSNTIVLEEINPKNMGALVALYEHKIFAQGILWNINSFDQWGVELGKLLAGPIFESIESGKSSREFDSSTAGIIEYILRKN